MQVMSDTTISSSLAAAQQPRTRLGRFHFLFLVSGIYIALLLTLRQLPCSICVPDCPKLSTQYHFGLMQQYCDIPRLYASGAVLKLIQSAICDLGCIGSPSGASSMVIRNAAQKWYTALRPRFNENDRDSNGAAPAGPGSIRKYKKGRSHQLRPL